MKQSNFSRLWETHRRGFLEGLAVLILVIAVTVYFGVLQSRRTVYAIVDRDTVITCTSSAGEPEKVLEENGISLGPDDLVTETEKDGYVLLSVARYSTVTVNCDGGSWETSTHDATVEALLEDLGISLDADDIMTSDGEVVQPEDYLYDGMEITVQRVTEETYTEISELSFDTVTYLDPAMQAGAEVIRTPGTPGEQETIWLLRYCDGELTSATMTGIRMLSPPVTEVRMVGSGPEPFMESDVAMEIRGEADEPDPPEEETEPEEAEPEEPDTAEPEAEEPEVTEPEPAQSSEESARTESAGTSSAVPEPAAEPVYTPAEPEPAAETVTAQAAEISGSSTITMSDGTVLHYTDVLSVTATSYTGGGTTATGTAARYGAIAVDPSVIPYGTKMYIVSDDGKWIYGEAVAEDCGGAIKGNIIDLYFDDYATCIQFGRRSCTVYILE